MCLKCFFLNFVSFKVILVMCLNLNVHLLEHLHRHHCLLKVCSHLCEGLCMYISLSGRLIVSV